MADILEPHKLTTYALVFAIALLATVDVSIQGLQTSGLVEANISGMLGIRQYLQAAIDVRGTLWWLYLVGFGGFVCLIARWHLDTRRTLRLREYERKG